MTLLSATESNPALRVLYRWFFDHIQVDETWVRQVRTLSRRGRIVYVLRNLNAVDYLALDHLTKRYDLPRIRFANELPYSFVTHPRQNGWLSRFALQKRSTPAQQLRAALSGGGSAALFLKRPPQILEPGGAARPSPTRGKTEGDAYLRAILEEQRKRSTPILLVPQVFVWTRSPDEQKHNVVDALFGPREWPGKIRTVTQFLMNFRHVTLRTSEPVDVKAFLENMRRQWPVREKKT